MNIAVAISSKSKSALVSGLQKQAIKSQELNLRLICGENSWIWIDNCEKNMERESTTSTES
jgi:hypothetical protein